MATISEINVRIGAVIDPLLKGMKDAERSLEKSARRLNSIGSDFTNKFSVPILAAGGAALKFSADVESSFTKIETLVGISGKALDELKGGVANLSGPLGSFQNDLSGALFTITSAGERGSGALKTLEQASKAAQIGLGNTTDIARVGVSVVNAYGREVINTSEAIDQLAAAARVGNFETEQLAPAIGKVLPIAKSLGISFSEVTANIATFTKAGLSAPEAVTGIKSLLTNIVKPSKEAGEALAEVGLTTDDLRESIQSQGLAKTLVDLNKLFNGNTEALARIIPNVEGLVNALATAGSQGEDYLQNLQDIQNATGIVDEGFKKVSETANFKFNQALVELQNASIELGNTFLPVAKDIIEQVVTLVKAFNNLDPSVKRNVVQFALYAAAIGPVLQGFAALQTTTAKVINLTSLIITNFKKGAGAALAFDAALKTTAIGLAATAIALLVKVVSDYTASANVAARSQEILAEGTRELYREVEKEKQKVNELFSVLKSDTATREEKAVAIQSLTQQYPGYLKYIDLEKASVSQLAGIQADLNRKILESVANRKKAELQSKFYDEIIEKELRIQEIQQKGFNALSSGEQFRGGFFNLLKDDRDAVAQEVIKELQSDVLKLKENAEQASSSLDNLVASQKRGKGVRGLGGLLKEDPVIIETNAKDPDPDVKSLFARQRTIAQDEANKKPLKVAAEVELKAMTEEERLEATVRAKLKLDPSDYKAEQEEFRRGFQPLVPVELTRGTELDQYLEGAKPEESEEDPVSGIKAYIEALTELKGAEEAAADSTRARTEEMKLGGAVALSMGESMAAAATQGASSFRELATAAISAAAQIIRAKIQEGVASVVSDAFKKNGLLGLIVAPAAGAAAGALFNSILAKIKVPALAGGGVAYGPTMALVGDNPNARVDPEVIAPLSKLESIMNSGNGAPINVSGNWELAGDKLLLLLDRAMARRDRLG